MGATTPVALFNALIKQIFTDLGRCDVSCDAIKTNRHCGAHHTELDALQGSLQAGIKSLKSAADGAGARSPTAEELAAADNPVAGFAKEVKSVCHKLEKIAKGHHDPHHHVEHPHFKELRTRWEDALGGILAVFEGLKGTVVAEVKVTKSETKVEVKEVVVVTKEEDTKDVEEEKVVKVEEKVETKETVEVKAEEHEN